MAANAPRGRICAYARDPYWKARGRKEIKKNYKENTAAILLGI